MPVLALLAVAAVTGLGTSANTQLVRAARLGDMPAMRRCFLDHKLANLDLNSALDAAAAYAHLSVVELLVAFGATDLDSALLSAAARDHAKVVSFLISKERPNPATNTRDAQVLAASMGSINSDWLLTAHRWEERRS